MRILNKQKPEKVNLRNDGLVEVHHYWKTIQGEGPFAGTPAIFIRLSGCTLQCPGCDTDYTSKRKLTSPKVILKKVLSFSKDFFTDLVVITGGEPLRQNLTQVCRILVENGFRVQIETNGLHYQKLPFIKSHVFVVCSPKTPRIDSKLESELSAIKYVVQDGEVDSIDGLPLNGLGYKAAPHRVSEAFNGEIYVQPMDEKDECKNKLNTKQAVESCMKFGYRLCLQTHKIIGLE